VTIITRLTGIVIAMAAHASRHRQISLTEKTIALRDLAMTVLTLRPAVQVRFVAEKNKIRLFVNAHPRNILLVTIERRQLLDGGAVFVNRLMATHALGCSGKAHCVPGGRIRVAGATDEAERQMLLVTIGNGLLWSLQFLLLPGTHHSRHQQCHCCAYAENGSHRVTHQIA